MLQVKLLLSFLLCIAVSQGRSSFSDRSISLLLIQVKIGPLVNCSAMTDASQDRISDLIKTALVTEINQRCHCSFGISNLMNEKFACNPDLPHYPTYRVFIQPHGGYSSQELIDFVSSWVLTGPSISDGVGTFTVDSSCPVKADGPDAQPCSSSESTKDKADVTLIVGVMLAEFVFLLILFAVIIVIVLLVCSARQRKLRRSRMKRVEPRKRLISGQSTYSSESSHPDVLLTQCEAYASIPV